MFRHCKDIIRVPESDKLSNVPKLLIQCEFCEDGWESETDLMFHKKEHIVQIKRMMSSGMKLCWNCTKKYNNEAALHKHISNTHFLSSDTATRIEREIFICNECEHIFFNKFMLTYHIMRVHYSVTKFTKLTCPKCQKTQTAQVMKSHFFTHDIYSLMNCPLCFYKCKNLNEFKAHIDSHERHYHCTICDNICLSSESFNKHCQGHHQSKPCDFVFHSQDYLKNFFVPRRRKWWKYQPYSPFKGVWIQRGFKICILCREICKNQKDMINHLSHHTEIPATAPEKTGFSCDCGQSFDYRILLKQHLAKCKTGNDEKETMDQMIELIVPGQKPLSLSPIINTYINKKKCQAKSLRDSIKAGNTSKISGDIQIVDDVITNSMSTKDEYYVIMVPESENDEVIEEIKEEVTEEVKGDVKEEVKEEIKEEVQVEIRDVKGEVKEVKQMVKEEVKVEYTEEVKEEIKEEVQERLEM